MPSEQHRYFKNAAKREVNNPHPLVHLARLHIAAGDYEKAARTLRHAIERHPGDQHAWNHMVYLIKHRKSGDVKVLKQCYTDLNALHPKPEAHVLKEVRDNVTLEDLEKFVHVGYHTYRDGKYPFLEFIFKALGSLKTDRSHVFLNFDWYDYGDTLSIKEDLPGLKLNIFAPAFEIVSDMSDVDILLVGNARHLRFLHQCKLYVSSPHGLRLHHVNHSPVFIRNHVKTYGPVHNSSLKVGGNMDLSGLPACHGNTLWVFGQATNAGVYGDNTVYLRGKDALFSAG